MLDQEQEPRSGGMLKFVGIGAVVVALVVAGFLVIVPRLRPAPEAPVEAPAPVKAAPAAVKPTAPEPIAEPEPPAASRPRTKKPKVVVPDTPPPPEPSGPSLVIESDVPGASIFVDRQYLGTTPVRTTAVKPGRHQLNASADGEDGIVQTIDVGESGDTTISLRFREVRLDLSTPVVHKHGVGSCEGTLRATPAGIRYDSSNAKDAFVLAFKDIEVFEIEYMKKELKIKQRGGRTWNFTDRAENADRLFVFHRDVTKAREKLTAQAK